MIGILVAMSMAQISVFDSTVHKGKTWVLVDECAVEVNTVDIEKNPDKVINQVNEFCNLQLDGLGTYATQEK
jgi:hypothetical protein